MKTPASFAVLAMFSISLMACTGRHVKPVQVENPQRPGTSNPQQPRNGQPDHGAQNPDPAGSTQGTAQIDLSKKDFASKAPSLNVDNLTYKFTYLDKTFDGKIVFQQDKASLVISGLPINKTGTVTLEILDAGVVKLRGSSENVLLKAGPGNTLALELKPVDNTGGNNGGGGGDTTDLTINVTLGSGGGNNPPPSGGGGGGGSGGGGGTDPIQNWDGKSNQGNDKWRIVQLDGQA